MVAIISTSKAQRKIAEAIRTRRLARDLTQEGLAERSGVPAPTLRKFERTGLISLQSYLKLEMALGNLDAVVAAAAPKREFSSIDEVLDDRTAPKRRRGRRK